MSASPWVPCPRPDTDEHGRWEPISIAGWLSSDPADHPIPVGGQVKVRHRRAEITGTIVSAGTSVVQIHLPDGRWWALAMHDEDGRAWYKLRGATP